LFTRQDVPCTALPAFLQYPLRLPFVLQRIQELRNGRVAQTSHFTNVAKGIHASGEQLNDDRKWVCFVFDGLEMLSQLE
jgi:hypothetical protein